MAESSGWARVRRSEATSGMAIISPPMLYAVLLLAMPLATVVMVSFYTDGFNAAGLKTPVPGFSLENYSEVVSSPLYRALMLRSLGISLSVTLITVLLAYPIAYYVSFHVRPERKALWLFLITIPFWTSYIIRVFMWNVVLGYKGVVSEVFEFVGIIGEPMSFLTNAPFAITVTLAHAYAPFAILPIYVALEKIDRSFLEAGQDLGETRFVTFLRVTLPLSMPGVIAAVMIVFIPTVGDYVTPTLMGDGKYPLIANAIETQMLTLQNRALGSALAVASMVVVAIVTLLFLVLNRRFLRSTSR